MQRFLLSLDAFRKVPVELTDATVHGAYLSILAYGVMVLLFFMELHSYLSTQVIKSVELDKNYSDTIWIDFDVFMFELPCEFTNIVVRDVIGNQEIEVLQQRITKDRIDRKGISKGLADPSKKPLIDLEEEPHPELEADWDSTSDHFRHVDFDQVLEYHDFTMVNFYADWCIHCRRFAPAWKEAEDQTDKMKFHDKNGVQVHSKLLRVNCVEFGELCARVGIRAYPTIRLYKRDKSFTQYSGPRETPAVVQFLQDFIQNEQVHHVVVHHSSIEEGCRVHGELQVRRVPGFFHLEADSHLDSLDPKMTNVSHKVNHIWFVDNRDKLNDYIKKTSKHVTKDVLKNLQPMVDQDFITYKAHTAPQHYVNVISTVFDNEVIVYQATAQSHIQDVPVDMVPQARFSYAFNPMSVLISQTRRPFYDFLTSVFAIVGGTYTFISLIHKFWDTVTSKYKKNIGKLG